jgi:hypothetical protein
VQLHQSRNHRFLPPYFFYAKYRRRTTALSTKPWQQYQEPLRVQAACYTACKEHYSQLSMVTMSLLLRLGLLAASDADPRLHWHGFIHRRAYQTIKFTPPESFLIAAFPSPLIAPFPASCMKTPTRHFAHNHQDYVCVIELQEAFRSNAYWAACAGMRGLQFLIVTFP